ncbi:ParB family protein [Vibrio owensii]|uniref:ParB family protein n=1 Tax=Vibrio owensii TaxID=696485 RepID=UPI003DA0B5C6|nr:ParB/RepB/Spo0J family partition protein [Vibrio parahaemolyticus]
MAKERKTLGRSLSNNFSIQVSGESSSAVFTLSSGVKAEFKTLTIPSHEVERNTWVRFEVNGRDQNALNREEVGDILRTIKYQQFFPAIAVKRDGRFEILDGSRRRMAAIFGNVGLNLLYTEQNISMDDAKQLAKDIQTAKEHSLREVGLRLLLIKDNLACDNKTLAKNEGLSESKVTRALQAASVPSELVKLFPHQSTLSYADYKYLLDLSLQFENEKISLTNFCNEVAVQITALKKLNFEEQKSQIIKVIKQQFNSLLTKPKPSKVVTEKLWDFEAKDSYARKKTKGRFISYEFNRISKDVQAEIDKAVRDVLERELRQ